MPFVLTSVVVFELCVTPLIRIRGSEQKFVDLLTYKKWVPMLVLSSSSLTYIRVRSEATEAVSQLLQRRKKWFTSKWLTCLAWLKACWPIGNLHLNSMQKPICLIEIIDDNNSNEPRRNALDHTMQLRFRWSSDRVGSTNSAQT